MTFRQGAVALVVALSAAVTLPLGAASHTWSGLVSAYWSDPANWSSGGPPVVGETNVDLTIYLAAHPDMTNDVPNLHVTSMFCYGGQTFSLGGLPISLGGAVSTFNAGLTIDLDIGLSAESSFTTTATFEAITLNGSIQGSFGIVTQVYGLGTGIILKGDNSYGGTTTVTGGNLVVGHPNALGATDGTPATGTIVKPGGSIHISGVTIGGEFLSLGGEIASVGGSPASWSGPIDLTGDSRVGSKLSPTGPLDLSGPISGPYGLLFYTGGNAVTLSGMSTFSGTSVIQAGTVVVTGAAPSATFSLNISGGTLAGTGIIGDILGGYIFMQYVAPGLPGESGTLSAANASLASSSGGATLSIRLNGTTAGSGYSRLVLSGGASLTYGGGLSAQYARLSLIVGFTPTVNDSFTILTAAGGVTGTFDNLPDGTTVRGQRSVLSDQLLPNERSAHGPSRLLKNDDRP